MTLPTAPYRPRRDSHQDHTALASAAIIALTTALLSGVMTGCTLDAAAHETERTSSAISSHPSYTLLSETGLYDDIAAKTIASDVLEFKPAYPLWTDSAVKRRWIELPAGETIDNTDQDLWVFPAGTRVWKEFAHEDGRLLETRLIEIDAAGESEIATFVWREDESDADRATSGASNVRGTTHDAPAENACQDCHLDTGARVLGFAAVQLSHDGAGNLTSPEVEALLENPPGQLFPVPGDAVEAAAIGYLHGNCGHCHDASNNRFLQMRVRTTDATAAVHETMAGYFVPGDPETSYAWQRMGNRTSWLQMPRLGTEYIDAEGTAAVEVWINRLDASERMPVSFSQIEADSAGDLINQLFDASSASPQLEIGAFHHANSAVVLAWQNGRFQAKLSLDSTSATTSSTTKSIIGESNAALTQWKWIMSSGTAVRSVWTSTGWQDLADVALSDAVGVSGKYYYRVEMVGATAANVNNVQTRAAVPAMLRFYAYDKPLPASARAVQASTAEDLIDMLFQVSATSPSLPFGTFDGDGSSVTTTADASSYKILLALGAPGMTFAANSRIVGESDEPLSTWNWYESTYQLISDRRQLWTNTGWQDIAAGNYGDAIAIEGKYYYRVELDGVSVPGSLGAFIASTGAPATVRFYTY